MNLACEGSRQAKRGGREQRPPRSSPSLLQARGLHRGNSASLSRWRPSSKGAIPAGRQRTRVSDCPVPSKGAIPAGRRLLPVEESALPLGGSFCLARRGPRQNALRPFLRVHPLIHGVELGLGLSSSHSLHSVELRGRPCIGSSAAVLGNRQEGHSADDRHEGDLHPPIIPGHIAGALDAVSY